MKTQWSTLLAGLVVAAVLLQAVNAELISAWLAFVFFVLSAAANSLYVVLGSRRRYGYGKQAGPSST
jgi:hypothetical protein